MPCNYWVGRMPARQHNSVWRLRNRLAAVEAPTVTERPPHLGLMWNNSETVHLRFALFAVSEGYGCRRFLRDGETTYTWEVAFSLKQDVIKGDNVISLSRRRLPSR